MCIISFPQTVSRAISRLEQAGFQSYAVGGCIRDSLLGKRPLDWDLTTSARPEQVKACFKDCRTVDTGIRHGTVAVILDGMTLEITTFRTEEGYRDHRHPDAVAFGDCLTGDLSRRDFTINAMACRPGEPVVDLYGGRADLKAKQIRCVGNPGLRFQEDALRMMRALRFAAVLGFTLERETARALREHAHLLGCVAVERLAKELEGLLAGESLVPVLMEYKDVLSVFLPEWKPFLQAEEWEHAVHLTGRVKGDSIQKLAALFAWLGEACCRNLLQRLRYDRKTVQTVCLLAQEWNTPLPQGKTELLHLLFRLGEENARRLTDLWLARFPQEPKVKQAKKELEQILRDNACYSLGQLEVNGRELAAVGIRPGPAMGHLLQTLLDQVLDGTLPNRKEALLEAAAKITDLS